MNSDAGWLLYFRKPRIAAAKARIRTSRFHWEED